MPAEAFEGFHALEGCFEPLHRVDGANPTEIAGGEDGEEIETDIGWRCPVGDNRLWIFLKIVGRQMVVIRSDEDLEETPGSACNFAQRFRVRVGDRQMPHSRRRTARPSRDDGRKSP